MRHLFPRRRELMLLVILACLLAALVWRMPSPDVAMASVAMPLFVIAALLGMWRHGHLAGDEEEN